MVRINAVRRKWAGVEFQPNLKKPIKPIKLGLVLLETRVSSSSVVIIGRVPRVGSRPPGFEDTSDLMMEIACRWVEGMYEDIADCTSAAVFETLAQRWKWNLYLSDVKAVRHGAHSSLDVIAKQLYRACSRPLGAYRWSISSTPLTLC